MIILPKRQIWTRQPQYVRRLAPGIPQPHALWIPGLGDVTRRYDTLTEADATDSFGRAYQITAAPYSRKTLVSSSDFVSTSGGFSVLVLTRQTGDQNSGGFNVGVVGGGATDRCALSLYDSDLLFLDYGGWVEGVSRVGVGGTSNAAGILGRYLATTGPSGMQLYTNGSLVASNSSNPSRGATSSAFAVGDIYGGTATAHNVGLIAVWTTQIPDALARSLSENPWSIFEQRSRHVFVVASGGGADVTLDPTTGSLTVTGQTPTITLPVSVTATTGAIVVTGNQPTTTNPVSLSPTTGAATISGETPSITLPVSLTPTTGSIAFTGNQPTIETGGGVTLEPTTGSVLFSGNAPTIDLPVSLTATTGSITFTGNQPTINTGADVIITPTTGSIFFSGQTPSFTLPVALTPTTGAIAFSGNAPSITLPVALTPSAGQLITTGNAPTITIGATATAILDLRYSARAVRRDYTAIYGQGSRNE